MKSKKLEELSDGEKVLAVTQLIGLGETQRQLYEHLDSHGKIRGNLRKSYLYHQQQLESLIKYQSGMRKKER